MVWWGGVGEALLAVSLLVVVVAAGEVMVEGLGCLDTEEVVSLSRLKSRSASVAVRFLGLEGVLEGAASELVAGSRFGADGRA